jgi:folate-binding protein YgfZ
VLLTRLQRFKIRVAAELSLEVADDAGDSSEQERIRAGWPAMGAEIIPGETIPAVTGLVALVVDKTKGCYPGQELVERMDSRGADAPQSLRILELGTDLPAGVTVGDSVIANDVEVGVVTSVGSECALALIKRGHELGVRPVHHPAPQVAQPPNS